MATGKHTPSFVSNLLDAKGGKMSEEELFYDKWTALSVYLGGADTVSIPHSRQVHVNADSITVRLRSRILLSRHDLASRDSSQSSRRDCSRCR